MNKVTQPKTGSTKAKRAPDGSPRIPRIISVAEQRAVGRAFDRFATILSTNRRRASDGSPRAVLMEELGKRAPANDNASRRKVA